MQLPRRQVLAALLAPAAPAALGASTADRAPLFAGMGSHRVDDASSAAPVRRYVAQGMVLGWGFNPAEAARSFRAAAMLEPGCAAAWWGLAWALGPTINSDTEPAELPILRGAIDRALAARGGAAPRWRGLVEALAARHPRHAAPDAPDEAAYERAMHALAARFMADADIATLAAEATMNLHPYDWWRDGGQAQPWTPRIEGLLERALRHQRAHPGANHAWVHLFERSPRPQRAAAAAERLRRLVPGSGHLLHMPAHIDMRLGRYAAAVRANQTAVEADRRYLEQVDAQGAYRVGYVAHNHHFLWAAAAMQGRSSLAIAAADEAWPAACGPRPGGGPANARGTLQHFQALPLLARVRFGRWQELLTGTRPPDGDAPYPLAMWHYARGTALLGLGRADAAREALAQLERAAAAAGREPLRVKGVHEAGALLAIARLTLRADIALAGGGDGAALADLAEAVRIEDGLAADEPHLWLAPTRHALGAALLRAGRGAEAERAFRADLQHYPDNGWSLAGLARSLQLRNRVAEAATAASRARQAWRDADIPPPALGRF